MNRPVMLAKPAAAVAPAPRVERAIFLVRSLDFGGAERQLVEVVRGLRARGREVSVLVFYPCGPLEEDLRRAGVPVLSLEKRGRWDVFGFARSLVARLRYERPAVIHAYMDIPNILSALYRPFAGGARVIWGFRASDMQLERYGWMSLAAFRAERLLSSAADRIIVNSRAGIEHRVRHGFSRERMVHIPNGIDVDRFQPDPAAGARVREEMGIDANTKLVGLVGRLDPMKDHPTFLEAAAAVAERRAGVHFVCVGNGPESYGAALRGSPAARRLGDRLGWLPSRSDVGAVYNALDMLCLSSAYGEGFPNVIGEAMACGVPCCATDVGDAAWIIGEADFIVDRGDAPALSAAIERLLPRVRSQNVRDVARQRIVENFSTDCLVDRTEAVLWPRE